MSDSSNVTETIPVKRTGLRRRSVRVLLGIVIAAVLVRAALPEVLRRVAIAQGDKALLGRIDIEDVDLALLTGGITVKGLRVYADDLPPPEGAQSASPATPTPQATPEPPPSTASKPNAAATEHREDETKASADAAAPMFSAARLSVDIGWRPLLHKIVEVQAIELEDFDARIDRLRNGTLVVPKPAPSESGLAEEAPAPESEGPGWGVLLERLSLRNGNLSFRDFTVDPEAKPLKAVIPSLEASNLALLISGTGLQPGTVALDADVLGGHLTLELTQRSVAAGSAFASHVVLTDLPISDALVYVPQLEWSALDGRLDLDVKHSFEPEGPHNLSGTVALRDMSIRVAKLDAPPLAWKKLTVNVADVDVVRHNARIAEVTLDNARLITRAGGPEPLPLLRGLLKNRASRAVQSPGAAAAPNASASQPAPAAPASPPTAAPASPPATSMPAPSSAETSAAPATPPSLPAPDAHASQQGTTAATPAPSEAPPSAPWTWQVDKVVLRDTDIDVLGGEKPLPLGVNAEVANLSSAPKTRSKVTLNVTPPEGTIALTGTFTTDPLGFDGGLKLSSVSLPTLSTPVATPLTRLLRQGALSTDLQIAAAMGDAPNDGAKVSGTISLDDFVITGEDDKAFAVRWKQLALDIQSIVAAGVLAKAPAQGGVNPISIAASSFTFVRPEFVITRTESGIALPEALSGSATGERPAENVDTATGEPEPAVAQPTAEAKPQPSSSASSAQPTQGSREAATQASSPVDARVARLVIQKMRIAITDKAVKPLYRSNLDPIDFSATDVRWPGPYANAVHLTARGLDGAKLTVTGDLGPTGYNIKADMDGMPLAPLSPYAASAGYGLGGGTASLHSRIKLKGNDYDTDNRLVLNKLHVTGAQGDSLFAQQFGMPLSLALALMTDLQGNITLNLPVSGGRNGTRIGVGTAVRDALKQAILSTATSPLKLIGAVAEIGQKPASLTPQPIGFTLGRSREAEGEAAKIDQLGTFLSSSAKLALRLHGETSDDDRRWMAEQKLRAKLEEESGFIGSVRHLGEGDEREAALGYLAARGEDKPAELPEQYKAWFEAAVAEQKVTDAELLALAQQRAEAVRNRLLSKENIAPARIVLDPVAPEDLSARAAVSISLETIETATAEAASRQ